MDLLAGPQTETTAKVEGITTNLLTSRGVFPTRAPLRSARGTFEQTK